MHGHHYGAVRLAVVAVYVRIEGDLVEKAGEGLVARLLYVAEDVRLQLVDVLEPGGGLVPALFFEGLGVARLLDHGVIKAVEALRLRKGAQGADHVREFDELRRGAAQLLVFVRAAYNVVEARALPRGDLPGGLHGLVTYAALGGIYYAREAQVVRRGEQDGEVGQHVLDLGAVEEAHAAHYAVGDAVALEGELKAVGLGVHAVEHGAVAEVPAAPAPGEDARGDELRLVVLVLGRVEQELVPVAGVCPKRLALALGVVGDNGVGSPEDVAGGAVVLLQADGAAALEFLFEAEDILDGGAAELVDALVVVAHHADVPPAAGEHAREQVLEVVRVLILVYQHIFELTLVVLEHVRALAEEAHRVVEQIVEVHGPGGEQALGIELVDLRRLAQPHVAGGAVPPGEELGREQLVARGIQPREHAFGRVDLVVQVQLAQYRAHDREAVRRVVNREVARVAQTVGIPPQYAHAGRVEGAGPDVVRLRPKHALQARLELVCGLVGEGDGDDAPGLHAAVGGDALRLRRRAGLQNGEVGLRGVFGDLVRVRRAAVFEQIGHAVYQHGGFSAARAGEDEQRPLRGQHGLPLHGVEARKVGLDDRAARCDIAFFKICSIHSSLFYHSRAPRARAFLTSGVPRRSCP